MTGRKSGVLLHISSLMGEYGIGTFGKEAKRFIDFLEPVSYTHLAVCGGGDAFRLSVGAPDLSAADIIV